MKEFMTQLNAVWDFELQKIQASEEHIVRICERVLTITRKALADLRTHLLIAEFKDKEEEIWFFKEAKPQLLSKLIYHEKLYNLELRRPLGRDKLVRKYLENEILHLEHSYESYTEFYLYFRTGQTTNDEHYFLRTHQSCFNDCEAHGFDSDPNLSTGYDCKVARILAQDMLVTYLNREIYKLKGHASVHKHHDSAHSLEWTGSKTSLVELIYGLAQAGVINHGKSDYKEIAHSFERLFNTSLGNIYKTFEKIRMRETGPTTFLDTVKVKLIDYTDKFNEYRVN
ncbi:RteC domain-containing protein [Paradesertivirga mongoliensis]|uniref:RteC domain-containing protein n=1 Tax=Paradesertivirga mongoliensis TaxID=2100740 RepID=A0ABW4ZS45_9SPHI|nr:RteC domain-containing protein [Pedobacter mongoliensis]